MARVLVAEDEKDIRELITFTLTFGGHTVTAVSNGAEAVESAQASPPDVIILDGRMPKMTGYEACKVIKEDEALKHIPVIFLSAKGQDEEVKEGMALGAAAYILKPFSPADLIERVGKLAQGQPPQ
jgi:CheY-like chemotaxis protein